MHGRSKSSKLLQICRVLPYPVKNLLANLRALGLDEDWTGIHNRMAYGHLGNQLDKCLDRVILERKKSLATVRWWRNNKLRIHDDLGQNPDGVGATNIGEFELDGASRGLRIFTLCF